MPPKNKNKKARGSVTRVESKLIRASQTRIDLATILSAVHSKPVDPGGRLPLPRFMSPSKESKTVLEGKDGISSDKDDVLSIASESKEMLVSPDPLLSAMAKTMFKADKPYRTRLGNFGFITTSAAGVLNVQIACSGVTSTGEWSTIDALFDEVFIHSMHIRFQPYNVLGAGTGQYAGAPDIASIATAGTPASGNVINAGAILASLFHGASAYGSATAMIPNPNHKIVHTGRAFSYFWRNNERFDPRGVANQASGSQSWINVINAGNYGGLIQMRIFNDQALGDAAHTFTCGTYALTYDLSFRVRS